MMSLRAMALVAAALLALAPTLSRLAQSWGVAAGEPMCTAAGLQPFDPATHPGQPALPGSHDDCGYCAVLAASSPAPPSFALAIPALALPDQLPRRPQAPLLAGSPFPALGSRAPPAL